MNGGNSRVCHLSDTGLHTGWQDAALIERTNKIYDSLLSTLLFIRYVKIDYST